MYFSLNSHPELVYNLLKVWVSVFKAFFILIYPYVLTKYYFFDICVFYENFEDIKGVNRKP